MMSAISPPPNPLAKVGCGRIGHRCVLPGVVVDYSGRDVQSGLHRAGRKHLRLSSAHSRAKSKRKRSISLAALARRPCSSFLSQSWLAHQPRNFAHPTRPTGRDTSYLSIGSEVSRPSVPLFFRPGSETAQNFSGGHTGHFIGTLRFFAAMRSVPLAFNVLKSCIFYAGHLPGTLQTRGS
jgi:hypothetical protein